MRIAIIAFTVLAAMNADACTTFCTRGLFGRNYDFEIGHGMVVVNKRGVAKEGDLAPSPKWTSKYGSVTFNQFGRDNPTGGMNEKGLVVELMWLNGTRYPAADARPVVGTLTWIQYQLDTAATVDDVIANDKRVRISERGVPLHYLVADANGNVAAIEFVDGQQVVYRGDALPKSALANDPYAWSLANDRTGRFGRAAAGLPGVTNVDDAFALLKNVAQSNTQWSIVYDIRKRAIHWRTAKNAETRSLAMTSLDFKCATPVRVVDIHTGRGNVAPLLRNYTLTDNLALVRRSTRETSFLRDTSDAEIDETARWPGRSSCAR